MKWPGLSEGAESQSLLDLILNTARIATTGTRLTMKLLNPAVLTEEVPRGFASSTDQVPCYLVWSDGESYRFTLHCICGLSRPIVPDSNGECYYEHEAYTCGWRVNLVLEGYGRWAETKEERAERRRKEREPLSGV